MVHTGLPDEEKSAILTAAVIVAYADGEFVSEEKAVVAKLGAALGLPSSQVERVVSDTQAGADGCGPRMGSRAICLA